MTITVRDYDLSTGPAPQNTFLEICLHISTLLSPVVVTLEEFSSNLTQSFLTAIARTNLLTEIIIFYPLFGEDFYPKLWTTIGVYAVNICRNVNLTCDSLIYSFTRIYKDKCVMQYAAQRRSRNFCFVNYYIIDLNFLNLIKKYKQLYFWSTNVTTIVLKIEFCILFYVQIHGFQQELGYKFTSVSSV